MTTTPISTAPVEQKVCSYLCFFFCFVELSAEKGLDGQKSGEKEAGKQMGSNKRSSKRVQIKGAVKLLFFFLLLKLVSVCMSDLRPPKARDCGFAMCSFRALQRMLH